MATVTAPGSARATPPAAPRGPARSSTCASPTGWPAIPSRLLGRGRAAWSSWPSRRCCGPATSGGQFWMDEGLSVGISTHPLFDIPHRAAPRRLAAALLHAAARLDERLRLDARPPPTSLSLDLRAAHASRPAPGWPGACSGRWAAVIAMVLFALNPFLTAYSQETRMYSLMALLGLLATGGIHPRLRLPAAPLPDPVRGLPGADALHPHLGRLLRGRRGVAFLLVWRASDERRALVKDARAAPSAVAAVLFLPWLPTLLYQAAHTGSPWDSAPNFGAPVQISRNLMGGDRATVALVLAARHRRGRPVGTAAAGAAEPSLVMWTLILIPVGTLAFGWIVSHFSPAWAYRYFAPIVGAAAAAGRGRHVARAGCSDCSLWSLVIVFWANPSEFTPHNKSDMRDVAARDEPVACTAATWSSSANPKQCRWPGTTCPPGCASPTPAGHAGPGSTVDELGQCALAAAKRQSEHNAESARLLPSGRTSRSCSCVP